MPDIALVAAIVVAVAAVIALILNVISIFRLRKTEELRLLEERYMDLARGLKEFRLLEAESAKADEEEKQIRLKKSDILLSEFFADVSWLCFLIRHGQIKDKTLVNAFKDQIITWYKDFEERMPPEKVHDDRLFPDFKILYQQFVMEMEKEREKKQNDASN